MGWTINEKITTELTWKEVSLITSAMYWYLSKAANSDPEIEMTAKMLVQKINDKMYDHPDNDEPNGH